MADSIYLEAGIEGYLEKKTSLIGKKIKYFATVQGSTLYLEKANVSTVVDLSEAQWVRAADGGDGKAFEICLQKKKMMQFSVCPPGEPGAWIKALQAAIVHTDPNLGDSDPRPVSSMSSFFVPSISENSDKKACDDEANSEVFSNSETETKENSYNTIKDTDANGVVFRAQLSDDYSVPGDTLSIGSDTSIRTKSSVEASGEGIYESIEILHNVSDTGKKEEKIHEELKDSNKTSEDIYASPQKATDNSPASTANSSKPDPKKRTFSVSSQNSSQDIIPDSTCESAEGSAIEMFDTLWSALTPDLLPPDLPCPLTSADLQPLSDLADFLEQSGLKQQNFQLNRLSEVNGRLSLSINPRHSRPGSGASDPVADMKRYLEQLKV